MEARAEVRHGLGYQNYGDMMRNHIFYIDKTLFIKEWWENNDEVTLITRPRRFGKTLNISMLEQFFSVNYADRSDLFEGMKIWKEEKYQKLQGTYPVINLSFANVKEKNYEMAVYQVCQILQRIYRENYFLLESNALTEGEKRELKRGADDGILEKDAPMALNKLSAWLYQHYGKQVIILLDEYDTPMQEAYIKGYWEELVEFIRRIFHAAFKTNPCLGRAVLTGITRISKESIFSDLNNLEVVTTTSDKYADVFGFAEEEVFAAMDEMGISEKKDVKKWYDGFNFGMKKDIYNPWSIINFLGKRKFAPYWANSSGNGLVSKLIREGSGDIKDDFGQLLSGRPVKHEIDEEIVFSYLDEDEEAIWSLLLAGGYLKVLDVSGQEYELTLTNYEVKLMFEKMVKGWFKKDYSNYNAFLKSLLSGDLKAMNAYMNRVALNTFSYFDTGKNPSGAEPERFYHGFVLGLLVEISDRYLICSNRESGFGRYDVLLEPLNKEDDGIILEFKVYNPGEENTLQDTVQAAKKQMEEKKYEQQLINCGVSRVRKYGFAFEGKKVLIG